MDSKQFLSAIAQIAEEKGISQEQIIETIEMAIAAAYKRDYGQKGQNIKVKFNPETGEIKIFQIYLVVEKEMLREEEPASVPSDGTSFRTTIFLSASALDERRNQDFAKFANFMLISDILPILDSFNLALENENDSKFSKGVLLIKMQLEDTLGKYGFTISHRSGLVLMAFAIKIAVSIGGVCWLLPT